MGRLPPGLTAAHAADAEPACGPDALIGEHPSMVAVRRLIARVAASPARNVLLYGETGTGKGLAARLLHRLSARAGQRFVDVNCAAIPANLLESELFGHERGAFTGALTAKRGLIEVADRGSLFLDEVRELDPTLQAKLLTLLDGQRFRRLGSVREVAVDVRFIASTNRILFGEVKAGRFREDLYYRLQVIAINIPPLRERGADVLVLADRFLELHNRRYGRRIGGLEPAVAQLFLAYSWPGNVRELENLLERIALIEDGDRVLMRHLPPRILREVDAGRRFLGLDGATPEDAPPGFHAATASFQRALIDGALASAGGRLGLAARQLGLTRHALRHQMAKLGMTRSPA